MLRSLLLVAWLFLSLTCYIQPGNHAYAQAAAFVNVSVLPMDRDVVLRNQTVLVREGVIVALGSATQILLPEDAVQIDGTGRFLMPGLSDLHVHLEHEADLPVYLASGVTTLLDLGAPPVLLTWRERVKAGTLLGPQLFVSYFIDGPGGRYHVAATTDDARQAIQSASENGYDYIKVYNSLTSDQFDVIMEAATAHDLAVIGHGVRAPGLTHILDAGQILIVHAEEFLYTFFRHQTDRSRIPEVVDLTKRTGIYVLPNLSTYEVITRQIGRPALIDSFLAMDQAAHLHPDFHTSWKDGRYTRANENLNPRLAFLRDLTRAFSDAGVPLLLGTDSPGIPGMFPGASIHQDLRNMVEAGLSPYQALSAGTRTAGQFIRETLPSAPLFGIITEGARADLVLLAGNPLEDLTYAEHPLGVMVNGTWWPADALHNYLDTLYGLDKQ